MQIQVTSGAGVVTQTVIVAEIDSGDVIVYRPCAYCGEKLVRAPRKTCCSSHRVLLCIANASR